MNIVTQPRGSQALVLLSPGVWDKVVHHPEAICIVG